MADIKYPPVSLMLERIRRVRKSVPPPHTTPDDTPGSQGRLSPLPAHWTLSLLVFGAPEGRFLPLLDPYSYRKECP
ncbi:hypothetical protein JTB14_009345 [Gonioctena quinquepunctata]|nr:hypothetical protein JTB14_009345 [Gonioctena quinquepunctata]